MKYAAVIITISICGTALIGDYIVFKSKYSQSQLFRAFTDGLVHLSIGFLSSLLFFSHGIDVNNTVCFCQVFLCALISWLIDIDHVFVAKSFCLKDMAGKPRGIFHCTTFWMLVTSALLLYSYLTKKLNLYILSYMIIIAYTSHHIRDANRRGLWMYPFGHTPVITKYVYIFLVSTLPHIYAVLYKYFEPYWFNKHPMYEYTMVV